jgi:O-antigen chain-terminating methyltransferase
VHVSAADAYLRGLPDGSLGAVFSSQVVEHLPISTLTDFLELSRRKLVPEGVLIMETANPYHRRALRHFWLDPTHQHPLYPEVMLLLCREAGFAAAFVFHPNGSGDVRRDRFRCGDYAVLARTS